jgi:hypothetical protein
MQANDFGFEESLTCEMVAQSVGARRSLVVRLARLGLIDTIDKETDDEPLLPQHVVVQLRRMQRLRRDLRVNFAGAAVILDLVSRIEQLNRELAEMQRKDLS